MSGVHPPQSYPKVTKVTAAEVARFLGISRVDVKKAVGRGTKLKKQGLLDE